MSQFIETIRATHGRLEDLRFHQLRVNETFSAFHKAPYFSLTSILQIEHIPNYPITKIRICYSLEEIISVEFETYTIKPIKTLSLRSTEGKLYNFKYADREWLKSIVNKAGTDDVILHHENLIKDASYANLAFYNGKYWYTPRQPLLNGTKRLALLQDGILIERDIQVNEIYLFEKVKLINAMMHWNESPELRIENIQH